MNGLHKKMYVLSRGRMVQLRGRGANCRFLGKLAQGTHPGWSLIVSSGESSDKLEEDVLVRELSVRRAFRGMGAETKT